MPKISFGEENSKFPQEVLIPSSTSDDVYLVTVVDESFAFCDCPGYRFRQHCKHLKMGYDEIYKS